MSKSDLSGVVLCKLAKGGLSLGDLRPLVREAKYICKRCGRAAARKSSLCEPKRLVKK